MNGTPEAGQLVRAFVKKWANGSSEWVDALLERWDGPMAYVIVESGANGTERRRVGYWHVRPE